MFVIDFFFSLHAFSFIEQFEKLNRIGNIYFTVCSENAGFCVKYSNFFLKKSSRGKCLSALRNLSWLIYLVSKPFISFGLGSKLGMCVRMTIEKKCIPLSYYKSFHIFNLNINEYVCSWFLTDVGGCAFMVVITLGCRGYVDTIPHCTCSCFVAK